MAENKTEQQVQDEKPAAVEPTNGKAETEEEVMKNGEKNEEAKEEEAKEETEKEEVDEKATDAEKESDDKEKEDEDDESSEEEELPPGLLEKPLIVETKRERKSVTRHTENSDSTPKKESLDYTKGTGVRLGDIPLTKHYIDRADTEDLHVLHRIMYRTKGKQMTTKRDIRNFCGFPFDKESKLYHSSRDLIDRLLLPALKWTLNLLGLETAGEAEELRDRLSEYLLKPHMIDKEVPPAKRKSEGGEKKKRRKSSTAKPKSKTKKSGSENTDDADDDSDVSEPSDDSDADNEDEKPAKKATPKQKKTPQSKTSAKKNEKKPGQVKIAIPTKKPKSATKKRKPSDESSDDDDEPLAKKTKVPPTDAELREVVSAILKDADLEQVTMKTVVRDVYEKYSSFDLTSRKDFIKETVKELIS